MIFSSKQCCDIVSNGYDIVPALQRCACAKNRLCDLSRLTSPLESLAQVICPKCVTAKLNIKVMKISSNHWMMLGTVEESCRSRRILLNLHRNSSLARIVRKPNVACVVLCSSRVRFGGGAVTSGEAAQKSGRNNGVVVLTGCS